MGVRDDDGYGGEEDQEGECWYMIRRPAAVSRSKERETYQMSSPQSHLPHSTERLANWFGRRPSGGSGGGEEALKGVSDHLHYHAGIPRSPWELPSLPNLSFHHSPSPPL